MHSTLWVLYVSPNVKHLLPALSFCLSLFPSPLLFILGCTEEGRSPGGPAGAAKKTAPRAMSQNLPPFTSSLGQIIRRGGMMVPPYSFLQHSSVAFSLAAENESGGESFS